MSTPRPLYCAGHPVTTASTLDVADKFTGAVAAAVCIAARTDIDRAIAAASSAAPACRRWPSHRRAAALERVAAELARRGDHFAGLLVAEVGKPITAARAEVARAIDTFRFSAAECGRRLGEHLPMDLAPRGEGYEGLIKRVPVGPCSLILPFNFPLNLLAHKIGPAIAAGCPFVAKPDPRTPLTALALGEILADCALPEGSWSILPVAPGADGLELFSEDPRLRLLSFTGSPTVGWALRAKAGTKKVVLELGGNAAAIIDDTADLDAAAAKLAAGAFGVSGQSCISVQRLYAHHSILAPLTDRLVARAQSTPVGDPRDERTVVGPMISEAEARRVEEWVNEAVAGGARLLCGGTRAGHTYHPTILAGVDPRSKVSCREVFGPVVTIDAYDDFDDALAAVNAGDFGLQAGLFSRDIGRIRKAWDELEVGGIMVNEAPTWRMDHMPYGGVKASGLGREGVRAAIDDMTEPRLLVLGPTP